MQEYTLAHIDKPDTLAGAEKALKKHEDFVSTMEANEDKIDGALQGGQRLVDNNNLYSGKVQEKMGSIQQRSVSMVFGQHSFKWSVDRRIGEIRFWYNSIWASRDFSNSRRDQGVDDDLKILICRVISDYEC